MAKSAFKHASADASPGFLLWKLTTLWRQKLEEILGRYGINQTQYAILASLKWFEEQGEPTTQSHLVEHAKIEKMTVSKSIRLLEQAGFVLRSTSTRDQRAVAVRFTESGSKIIRKAIAAVENADDEFFGVLNQRQLAEFKTLTADLIGKNGSSDIAG
ncbi:MAG: MarR family transcriptional regulator [Leptospirales bacterium]|nr:MarR family transcriptional regulator [Leptospirales bacterium]